MVGSSVSVCTACDFGQLSLCPGLGFQTCSVKVKSR